MDPRMAQLMNFHGITQQTLDMVKQAAPQDWGKLEKIFNTALGLVWYDLEPTAKLLYPVITPLRNMIPRVGANGGTATNWKVITAINANSLSPGVSEGNRTAKIVTTTANKNATYKALGFEDAVTFEADYGAQNFDDVKALAVLGLLRSLMIGEEKVILYGNPDFQINGGNAAPTPTAATSNNTGNLTANTVYHCRYVPLTAEGYYASSISGGVAYSVTRTNVDGSNDTYNVGCGKMSAANNANASNKTSIDFAVPAANIAAATLKGAVAYAWYVGDANVAANLTLTAITAIPKFNYKGNETQGTQTANNIDGANDHSNDALLYQGLWYQICEANSNGYYRDLGGNNLTGENGTPNITEFDTAFKSFWDNYRLSPDLMLCNAQEIKNINAKIMAGNGLPVMRFNMDAAQGGIPSYTAGAVVGSYLNKYSMDGGALVKIMLHPNMPPGSIMFYSTRIPYPLSNVQNVLQMKMRRDYYQIEWPLVKRQYEYGVYEDGLLQNYFPPAFGLISGINDG